MKKLKLVLVKSNKLSIEVGDLTIPNHRNKINEGELGIAVRSFVRNDAYSAYDIILVDTEAEIDMHDLVSNGNYSLGVASTSKSHNIPQLSEQSIKLLVEYYSSNGKLPEIVEVVYNVEALYATNNHLKGFKDVVKLNPQGTVDISLPKPKLYTPSEVLTAFKEYLTTQPIIRDTEQRVKHFEKWFNENKK